MWAIHLLNVRLTFWIVTISSTQIPDVLVKVHVIQCLRATWSYQLALILFITTQGSHICGITPKVLVKLQLKLPKITYKAQFHLIRNQYGTYK
jgi:hypothetical protein